MDAEDSQRISKHLDRLLTMLKNRRVMTNHAVRRVAGSRGMARVNTLQKMGHPITVRKLNKSTWEVRYDMKPLGRDAGTRMQQKTLFEMHSR